MSARDDPGRVLPGARRRPGIARDGANDVLFLGCVGQGRSTDSGQNFTQLAGLGGLLGHPRLGLLHLAPAWRRRS